MKGKIVHVSLEDDPFHMRYFYIARSERSVKRIDQKIPGVKYDSSLELSHFGWTKMIILSLDMERNCYLGEEKMFTYFLYLTVFL